MSERGIGRRAGGEVVGEVVGWFGRYDVGGVPGVWKGCGHQQTNGTERKKKTTRDEVSAPHSLS